MNKAGSCTAAAAEAVKRVQCLRTFWRFRNSTVLRFGAGRASSSIALLHSRSSWKARYALATTDPLSPAIRHRTPKIKNHRQGIAGGFGGLASSRVKALLKAERQPDNSSGDLMRTILDKFT
jgi:hypothetical protein